jgi:hypothetical protein
MEQHAGLAYACYFLLGSGILAPWNAFITGDPNATVVSSCLLTLLSLSQDAVAPVVAGDTTVFTQRCVCLSTT